jgi:hypothetical protein
MRTVDGQIISRSEFAVKPEMTLEMAIIMRHAMTSQNNKCPLQPL